MLFACAFQQVPGQKASEDALGNLAGQGILGSLLVLALVAIFLLVRALLKSKDDRFTDQKAMAEALGKVNEGTKDLAIEMKEHAANQVVEANKSQDAMRNALVSQEKSLSEMKTSVNGLQQEQARLAAAVTTRHGKTG